MMRRCLPLLIAAVCLVAACGDEAAPTTTVAAATTTVAPTTTEVPTTTGAPTTTEAPTTTAAPTTTVAEGPLTIDRLMAECPTVEEVAAIDADLALTFEADSTGSDLACEAAQGSADLTALQKRAYNAVRAMQVLPFDAPLPWTELGLYEWFVGAVDGMRFRGDIDLSFCCEPDGIINLVEGEAGQMTDLWVNPQNGVGLADLMILMVHEARHNEGVEHTCGNATMDATLEELGAWGVQYSLLLWLADHVPAAFMAAPVDGDPGYYQEMHRGTAEWVAETFICG